MKNEHKEIVKKIIHSKLSEDLRAEEMIRFIDENYEDKSAWLDDMSKDLGKVTSIGIFKEQKEDD